MYGQNLFLGTVDVGMKVRLEAHQEVEVILLKIEEPVGRLRGRQATIAYVMQ